MYTTFIVIWFDGNENGKVRVELVRQENLVGDFNIVATKENESRESIYTSPERDVFFVSQRNFNGFQQVVMDRLAICKQTINTNQ